MRTAVSELREEMAERDVPCEKTRAWACWRDEQTDFSISHPWLPFPCIPFRAVAAPSFATILLQHKKLVIVGSSPSASLRGRGPGWVLR